MNVWDVAPCRLVLTSIGFWAHQIVIFNVPQNIGILVSWKGVALLRLAVNGFILISSEHKAAVEAVRLLEAIESPCDASPFPYLISQLLQIVFALLRVLLTTEEAHLDIGVNAIMGYLNEPCFVILTSSPSDISAYMLHVLDGVHEHTDNLLEVWVHQVQKSDTVLSRCRVKQYRSVRLRRDLLYCGSSVNHNSYQIIRPCGCGLCYNAVLTASSSIRNSCTTTSNGVKSWLCHIALFFCC